MSEKKTTWARMQMLLIASVFFGPLAVATYMYYSGAFLPEGKANHGTLLEPVISVVDELPNSEIGLAGDGFWVLIYVNDAQCAEECGDSLYILRQSRKMLGREMDRLQRVFLHGETLPDTVFLDDEHAGLISMQDSELMTLLNNKKPASASAGGYFLMDPLGNLVMYFAPETNPGDMVEDLKRLLRLSRIG